MSNRPGAAAASGGAREVPLLAGEPFTNAAVPTQQEMAATAPAGVAARQALDHDELMTMQEQSPAYRALHESNLINSQYRVRRASDLDVIHGNATQVLSSVTQCLTCNGCCCLIKFFTVDFGRVAKGRGSSGEYLFFGEGVHIIHSPYVTVEPTAIPLTQGSIIHGTKAIVTVEQGFVGLAMDRGQPVLLPPGLHQWDSPTIEFVSMIDLSSCVIRLGPYTLITVDEGYAAVTEDNGKQKILDGGSAYMLTHRNWKFEKFITKKLQTNDVGPIKVTTGDNVPLETTATVNWLIEDVQLAARMAANTMKPTETSVARGPYMMQGQPSSGPTDTASACEFDISKLRQDVLRQVTASLAAFIGSVSYSAHGHAAMSARIAGDNLEKAVADGKEPEPAPEEKGGAKALFDREMLSSSVQHANEICSRYGVRILSINLISAYPADRTLLEALSQGAVATVAAEQTETSARGEARAVLLKARAHAEAEKVQAEGAAAAEELRAEGHLKAARRLESSEVAVTLAKLRTAGNSLGEGKANSFFFGLKGPGDLASGVLGSALLAPGAAGASTL